MPTFTKNQGFTIIELTIGIIIIAIVLGLGYPTYKSYLLKSRRSDAIAALLDIQAAQEKYRTSHTTYGNLSQVWGNQSVTPGGYYNLSISNTSGTAYTITATATGSQTGDTTCATITLSKSGSTETKSPSVCW